MSRSRYTIDQRVTIKQMIWEGQLHKGIAYSQDISIHSIRSIISGMLWHDTPWPDGSLGYLSEQRRDEILLIRNRMTGGKSKTYGPRSVEQLTGHLSRRTFRSAAEEIDYEAAKVLAGPDATEDMIQQRFQSVKASRLEYEERQRQEQEEKARLRRIQLDEEQAAYEREMAMLGPEVETEADRETRLLRLLWDGTELRREIADQLGTAKIEWLLDVNKDNPEAAKLIVYLEERKEADNAETDSDESSAR